MTIADLMKALGTDDLKQDFETSTLLDAIDYLDANEHEAFEQIDREMRQFEPELYKV